MKIRARSAVATVAVAIAGVGVGARIASAADNGEPGSQPSGQYVFACVNRAGKIDYLEFRKPLPHQCWVSGESLWHWAVAPASSPSPSPSVSPSPSLSASPISTSSN